MPDSAQVQAMFGRIAPRYDLLNRILSMGIDQGWRRRILRETGPVDGRRVLDVCCGTGDLALLFAREGAEVVGVDFTGPMLERAVRKPERRRSLFVRGDALRLPLADDRVDFATVAFGIRNVADRLHGFAELARVVRPGGKVFVLEFSMPPGPVMSGLYRFYLGHALPRIGALVSGDGAAYRYLPDTVLAWPSPSQLEREMAGQGLVDCGHALLSRGIACLSYGTVPPVGPPTGASADTGGDESA